jgi:large subunit ribosomal protein L31
MSEKNTATKKAEKKPGAKKAQIFGHHPNQHKVTVVMTDGTKFEIMTTWGKEGDVLKLDVDPKNHPAWQDKAQNFVNSNNERMAKFKQKFGDFKL